MVGSIVANYWERHSEILIKDLIEVIIAELEPCMNLNKIEGDAALFFSEDKGTGELADVILEHMAMAKSVFNKRLK